MPRRTKTVPQYRKHRASGQAIVTLNGRDHYLGPHGSIASRTDYDRIIAEWLANGRRCLDAESGKPPLSVNELILAYWRYAESYYVKNGKPTSEQSNIQQAMRFLKRLYGGTAARDFGPLALKAVREAMIAQERARMTINKDVVRIKRLFRWATENELVDPTVYHGLRAVAGLKRGRSSARETAPVKPVDDHQVAAIRIHVARQVWAMVQLQLVTGMRSGEVVIMRACDIEMDGKIWIYRPAAHKTQHHEHERIVEIGPKGQAIIKPFLKRDIGVYLFSPAEAEAERRTAQHANRNTPLSQGNRPGTNRKRRPNRKPQERYTSCSYRRAIDRGIRKAFPHPELADIPRTELTEEQCDELRRWHHQHHWHPHQLRHAFATRVRKKYGLEAAKILLGQATIAAAEIYAEAERSRAAEIVAKIG